MVENQDKPQDDSSLNFNDHKEKVEEIIASEIKQ